MEEKEKTTQNFFWIGAFFLPAFLLRFSEVVALGGAPYPLALLRGAISDLVLSTVLATILPRIKPLFLAYFALVIWCVLLACNREFILVQSANLSLSFLGSGDQTNFLQGSVLIPSLFRWAAGGIFLAFVGGLLGEILRRRVFSRRPISGRGELLASCLGLVLLSLWQVNPSTLNWLQSNLLEENARRFAQLARPTASLSLSEERKSELTKEFFQQDLSGTPLVRRARSGRRNVLFLIIEGLSQDQVDAGWMPFLQSLQSQGIWSPEFVSQNRQTHTGLHSILCGEIPNLSQKVSKAEIVGIRGSRRPCLPAILGESGYHTLFMQAGDLSFTRQDRISKNMGFTQLVGKTDLGTLPVLDSWGPEDISFLKESLKYLSQLQQSSQPWFATLMTIGTHHPYGVTSDDVRAAYGDREIAAYQRADRALQEFYRLFQEQHLNQDTLLVIMGDESSGRIDFGNNPQGQLPANHGYFLALVPEKASARQELSYLQSDIMISLLDYLEIAPGNTLGRSIFRDYGSKFRPLLFANIYLDRFYIWKSERELDYCLQDLSICQRMVMDPNSKPQMFHAHFQAPLFDASLKSLFHEVATINDLQLLASGVGLALQEENVTLTGFGRLYHGFQSPLAKGKRIFWKTLMVANPKNESPTRFWLSIYDWKFPDTQLISHQIELAPGEEREFNWYFDADKDYLLESTLEFGQGENDSVLVKRSTIEVQ